MRSLSDYLENLDRHGRLARVDVPIDCDGEAVELARRLTARRRALLATAPTTASATDFEMPLAMGLYGSDDLVRAALAGGQCTEDELIERIRRARSAAPAGGWIERVVDAVRTTGTRIADRANEVAGQNNATDSDSRSTRRSAVRTVRRPPCQQVVRLGEDINVGRLPVPRLYPNQTPRLLTAALVTTADPDTHRQRIDRADVYLIDRSHVAIDLGRHDPADRLRREYRRRREPMPIAITLGGDPALLPLAVAPLDRSIGLLDWASRLRQRPIDVARARTVDLDIPADAELVLEGLLEPDGPTQLLSQRPLYTGLIGRARRLAVVELQAVTERVDAVLPAMVRAAGSASVVTEEITLRRTVWRLFRDTMRSVIPELIDLDFWPQGDGRNWLVVSIDKDYSGQAARVIHALWGWSSTMFTRYIVVVDRRVDVSDPAAVVRAISRNARPDRDIIRSRGPEDPHGCAYEAGEYPDERIDETGRNDRGVSRLGIDATIKGSAAGVGRPFRPDRSIREQVDKRWDEYGIE